MVRDDDRYVIGVDYGTLSGRALVVRVSDGAELGSAVLEYPHGVVDTRDAGLGPPPPAGLGPAGALPTTSRCCAPPCRPRSRPPASTRPTSSASPPTSPPARWCRPSPTARRCATPTSSRDEPHAYVKLWKHHAAQGQADRITELARERGETWLARYGGVISSEWEFAKGAAAARGGARGLRRDGPLGRGRRLDRLAAHRHLRAQRLHRRLQGHPAGRRLPVAATTSPPSTRTSSGSSRTSSTTRSASSATSPAT